MTRRHFFTLLPAATLASALATAAPVPDPSAEEIQQLVKISYIRQNMSLKGQLRNDETGAKAALERLRGHMEVLEPEPQPVEVLGV